MADGNFRYDRGRDPPAWDNSRQAASDPLAELARLIGQGDTYPAEADRRDDYRNDRHTRRANEPAPAPSVDWPAEDRYAGQDGRAEDHYAPPLEASHQPYVPPVHGYEDEAPAAKAAAIFPDPRRPSTASAATLTHTSTTNSQRVYPRGRRKAVPSPHITTTSTTTNTNTKTTTTRIAARTMLRPTSISMRHRRRAGAMDCSSSWRCSR